MVKVEIRTDPPVPVPTRTVGVDLSLSPYKARVLEKFLMREQWPKQTDQQEVLNEIWENLFDAFSGVSDVPKIDD